MEFDDVLPYVGEFKMYQIILFFLIGIFSLINGYLNLAANFIGGDMDHWCKVQRLQNFTHEQQRYIAVPYVEGSLEEYDSCRVFDLDFTLYTDQELLHWNRSDIRSNVTKSLCTAWNFDYSTFTSTISSEWNLVCGQSWMVQFSSTMFNFGVLLGCIAGGMLSDRFGRKRIMIISTFLMAVLIVVTGYCPTYSSFIVFRVLQAAAQASNFQTSFMILMELIGPTYRATMMVIFQFFFSVGVAVMSGFSFAIRDFRLVHIVMAAPPFVCLVYYWIVPESPRWLISQGRCDEAEQIVRKIAAVNKTDIPKTLDFNDLETTQAAKVQRQGTLVDIFRNPTLRKEMLFNYMIGFTNTLIYYGLSLNAGSLAGSVFVNTTLMGLVDLPGLVFCIIGMEKIGRRCTMSSALAIGALFSFLMIPLMYYPDLSWALTVLSLLGKGSIASSNSGIYIYTSELFPTSVRSVALGSTSMVSRISGMAASYMGESLSNLWLPLPSVLFGTLAAIASVCAYLLPETLNRKLPETFEEAENLSRKISSEAHTLPLGPRKRPLRTISASVAYTGRRSSTAKLIDLDDEEGQYSTNPALSVGAAYTIELDL